jgi:hypothetical protein
VLIGLAAIAAVLLRHRRKHLRAAPQPSAPNIVYGESFFTGGGDSVDSSTTSIATDSMAATVGNESVDVQTDPPNVHSNKFVFTRALAMGRAALT